MTAHQRLIRDQKAALDPRAPPSSLDGYKVALISRSEAMPVIMAYEWLGNPGGATVFVGLLSPRDLLEGVAAFGYGPAGPIRRLIGDPALCLERGACVHYAPPNAASYLINRACRFIHRAGGASRFFAYADPSAGEYGAVYQAAGWTYLGQGLNGAGRDRECRYFVLPPGLPPDDAANWKTTRALRREGRRLTLKDAEALGWRVEKRPAKHVYATHVGAERRAWKAAIQQRPYPAPEPSLKRRHLRT